MRILLPIFFLSLTACSVYKSRVRQQFEDNSPNYVTNKALPGECATISPVRAWWQREFPAGPTELLFADAEMEIRRVDFADGHVLLRADRVAPSGTESCEQTFPDENAWLESRAAYFEYFGVAQPD